MTTKNSTISDRVVFVIVVLFVLAALAVSCNAQTTNIGRLVTTQSLNTNQFATNASGVNIKSNAFATNFVSRSGFQSYASDATTFIAVQNATATAAGAIAIGNAASATGGGSISIGDGSTNSAGVLIGSSATNSSGRSAVVIGASASIGATTTIGAIAIGQLATNVHGIAIGATASSDNFTSVALGHIAEAEGSGSIAIGYEATTDGINANTNTIAIGYSSAATRDNAIAIGGNTQITGTNSIIIGYNITNANHNVVVVGNTNHIGYNPTKHPAITSTDLLINTPATNTLGTRAVFTIGVRLISAADGFGQSSLYVLQDSVTNIFGRATFSSGAVATNDQQLVGYLQPGAIYYVTNTSSGSASAATISGTANLIGQ